jgi:hypothetical protein
VTGRSAHTLPTGATREGQNSMWPVIPALTKDTEAACQELRRTNAATATSACERLEPHEIQLSPTEPPAPRTGQSRRQLNDTIAPKKLGHP